MSYTKKFVRYIGGAALAGRQVALHKDGDEYVLHAETVRGVQLKASFVDHRGQRHYRTVADQRVSKAKLEALEADWESGAYNPVGDAAVTNCALRWMFEQSDIQYAE